MKIKHYYFWVILLSTGIAILSFQRCSKLNESSLAATSENAKDNANSTPLAYPPTAQEIEAAHTEAYSRFKQLHETPIDFYGKVVDQHGVPIVGATVKIIILGKHEGKPSPPTEVLSGSGGLFHVLGEKGLALGIEIRKEGYISMPDLGETKQRSLARIDYGLLPDKGRSFADPSNPTVFTLYSVETEAKVFHVKERVWALNPGQAREVALDSRDGVGLHKLTLLFKRDLKESAPRPAVYDWEFEIKVENGGIQESVKEYDFIAPENGYLPSMKFSYKKEETSWVRFFTKRFFIKFQDGSYGRIILSVDSNVVDLPVEMASWLNLEPGSRDLRHVPKSPPRDLNSFKKERFGG